MGEELVGNGLLRAYFFVNDNYMNQRQWGIQSVHCLQAMIIKNTDLKTNGTIFGNKKAGMIIKHSLSGGAVIFLRGFNVGGLEDAWRKAAKVSDKYPVAAFYEDHKSLNSSITCVGMVVPEQIWMTDDAWKPESNMSQAEKDLAQLIQSAEVAR